MKKLINKGILFAFVALMSSQSNAEVKVERLSSKEAYRSDMNSVKKEAYKSFQSSKSSDKKIALSGQYANALDSQGFYSVEIKFSLNPTVIKESILEVVYWLHHDYQESQSISKDSEENQYTQAYNDISKAVGVAKIDNNHFLFQFKERTLNKKSTMQQLKDDKMLENGSEFMQLYHLDSTAQDFQSKLDETIDQLLSSPGPLTAYDYTYVTFDDKDDKGASYEIPEGWCQQDLGVHLIFCGPLSTPIDLSDWTIIAYLNPSETNLTQSTRMVLDPRNMIDTVKSFLSTQSAQSTGNVNFVFLFNARGGETEEGFVQYQKNGTVSSHSWTNHRSSFHKTIVISQFIRRAYMHFPAKRYAFIVHVHGTGCLSLGNNSIKVYADALAEKNVDLMILGSCYMQDIESAYQLRNSVKYYITGQATVWADSIVMGEIFKRIFLNAEKSNLELAKIMVDTMTDQSISPNRTRSNEEAISAIDTSKLSPVIEKLNQLSKMATEASINRTGSSSSIHRNSKDDLPDLSAFPYLIPDLNTCDVYAKAFDLKRVIQSIRKHCFNTEKIHLECDQLLDLLDQAIVDFKKNPRAKDVTGLSIMSRSSIIYPPNRYFNLDFYKDTPHWEF